MANEEKTAKFGFTSFAETGTVVWPWQVSSSAFWLSYSPVKGFSLSWA